MMVKRSNIFFFSALFCMIAVSAYLQFTSYINLDSANALYEAKLLFSGGKYFFDFYETTPPLFLYLYFPIVIILKYFPSANFLIVFFIYYLLLSLGCVYVAYRIAQHIFNDHKNIKQNIFLLAISFIFLVIGANYFGQREHTALILTIPYFLLFSLRLEGKAISARLCIIVGILAGIGFAIKPHFCIGFILSEIYLLIVVKRFSKIWRIENCIIYSIFITYLVSTYLLYPAYFYVIVPLTSKFYYVGISAPFWKSALEVKMLYVYLALFFYFIQKRGHSDKALINSITIGMIGFVLSYFSELVPWDYHLFPAYGFTLLLNLLLLYAFITEKSFGNFSRINYILFAIIACFFDMYCLGIRFYFFIPLLLFCISWYFGKYFWEKEMRILSTIGLTVLIFIFPIYSIFIVYNGVKYIEQIEKPIVSFLHTYAYGKPVYFLTAILSAEYPAVDYAGAVHVSRFPYLLWLPAYIKAVSEHKNNKRTAEIRGMNIFFTNLLSKDIELKKPLFILVDASKYKNTPTFAVSNLNYLTILSANPKFKAAWKNYHFYATIDAEPNYQFDVYKLKASSIPV